MELPPDDVSAVGMGRTPQQMMRGRVGARTWGSGPGYQRSAPPARPSRPLRPSGDEAYVDRSEGSDLEELYVGMAVRHAKFGVGNVTGVTDGVPPRVRVAFPSWGEKTLVASFLEPA